MRGSLLFLCLVLLGCSGSHESDAGPPDGVDAGPPLGDAGGSDAGAPDAGPPSPTSCDPVAGDRIGEPCFCRGPATLFGRALYRQSIGVEVWDLTDPLRPALARTIMERAGSEGGLAIAQGHLLSVGNFEEGLRVYGLDDPLDPTLLTTHPLPGAGPGGLIATEDFAVVISRELDGMHLRGVDLTSPSAPTDAYDIALEGEVTSYAIDGDTLYLGTREGPPFVPWLEVLDLRTGDVIGRHQMPDDESSGYFSGLGVHRGRLVRATVDGVQILEVGADPPVEIGRFDTGTDQPIAVGVVGDLAVVGGSAMFVLSLEDPTSPRQLSRTELGIGDVQAVLADAQVVYASSGNGLLPVQLGCE